VTSRNVTDSADVMVLASASPSTYPEDPRLVAARTRAKSKKKIKSGV
jgi:PiT family inorganic phosphate transporter